MTAGGGVRNESSRIRVVPLRDMTMVHYIQDGWVTREMPYHHWWERG